MRPIAPNPTSPAKIAQSYRVGGREPAPKRLDFPENLPSTFARDDDFRDQWEA
jgi:hypothetical protein